MRLKLFDIVHEFSKTYESHCSLPPFIVFSNYISFSDVYCQIWHKNHSRAAQNLCAKTQTYASEKEIGTWNQKKTLKLWQNKKGQIFVWAAPRIVSFSLLPAVKKDTILGAAETNFRPSSFCDCFREKIDAYYL